MLKRRDALGALPMSRVLTETDHPFGDRTAGKGRRPGQVATVEETLAALNSTTPAAIRLQLWRTLRVLVSETGVGALLPDELRRHLAAA
jgi:TatD DNase family protein